MFKKNYNQIIVLVQCLFSTNRPGGHGFCPCRSQSKKPGRDKTKRKQHMKRTNE